MHLVLRICFVYAKSSWFISKHSGSVRMQLFDLLLNIEGLIFRKSSLSQAVLLLWKVFFSVLGETLPNLVNDINIKTQSVRGGIWQSVWPCGAALCCLCTQVGYFWLRTKPNSTTALLPLYKWGQWGVADIFIAATWGRDQRRWMSKTCKTTSYGTGPFCCGTSIPQIQIFANQTDKVSK